MNDNNFLEFQKIRGGDITSLAIYNEFDQFHDSSDETPSIPLTPDVRFTQVYDRINIMITDRNLTQIVDDKNSNIWKT